MARVAVCFLRLGLLLGLAFDLVGGALLGGALLGGLLLGCERASPPAPPSKSAPLSAPLAAPPAAPPSAPLAAPLPAPLACRPSQRSSQIATDRPAAAQRPRARVIIVGGGLAGLVTAYELERRGIPVQILEADSRWGGRVATAEYEGSASAEYGMQELWASNPLLGIARELGIPLDDKPVKPYSSAVIDGKLHPYLPGGKEAYFDSFLSRPEKLRLLSWLEEAKKLRERAEKEGLKDPEVGNLQSLSFAAWVESARLPRNAAELLRLLIECELATSWHGFSALFGLIEFGMFLGDGQLAYHIRGGNSRLIDGLVAAIRGDKVLSALVTRVERQRADGGQGGERTGERIGVRVVYQQNRRVHTVEAERIVLAVPFWRLHQIEMIPALSGTKWSAISTLMRGQYTVVHLLMPASARKLWTVGGEPTLALLTDGPLGVVYGPSGDPVSSMAGSQLEVFSLLVHGQAAAAFHMVPRESKLQAIYAQLDKLWPGLSKHVQTSQVYTYHPGAVPVWPPGRSPLDALSQALREPELGLYLAGDYLYSAHADGAARSGLQAAERIAAELKAAR